MGKPAVIGHSSRHSPLDSEAFGISPILCSPTSWGLASRGSTAGQKWTVRVTGDPATGNLSIGGIGVNVKTRQPVFTKALSVSSIPTNAHPGLMLIEGSTPEGVRTVRLLLSNGSTKLVPTVNSTLDWRRRLFGTALRFQTAHISRIEGLNARGKVVLTLAATLDLRGHTATRADSPS